MLGTDVCEDGAVPIFLKKLINEDFNEEEDEP